MKAMHAGLPQEDRIRGRRQAELVLGCQQPMASAAPVREGLASDVCRIALVGFGTVGQAVARLLRARPGDHRLRLTQVCNRHVDRKRVTWTGPDVLWTENFQQVLASDADVVVELMGGVQPAHELVRRSLQAGKSVVTANKQLIAYFGSQLLQLATDHGQYLGFGACVAGGVPVLSGLQDGLAGDRLVQVRGILNGTCNYILSRIEQAGISFFQALCEAQQAGFAEADPSYDIDGQDAGAKLAILARIGLRIDASPEQVVCRTIRHIAAIDFEYARGLDCTIRQISTATLRNGTVYLAVEPSLVNSDSPLAKVSGSENLIVSTGEFGGATTFGGLGAGGDPTAVAVVSDLIQAACYRSSSRLASPDRPGVAKCKVGRDAESSQYCRFVVRDRPGIVASLAGVFARHSINLDAILQKPGHAKSVLPFVITLEPCRVSQLEAALAEISQFDFLVEAPVALPILR